MTVGIRISVSEAQLEDLLRISEALPYGQRQIVQAGEARLTVVPEHFRCTYDQYVNDREDRRCPHVNTRPWQTRRNGVLYFVQTPYDVVREVTSHHSLVGSETYYVEGCNVIMATVTLVQVREYEWRTYRPIRQFDLYFFGLRADGPYALQPDEQYVRAILAWATLEAVGRERPPVAIG